VTDSVETPAKRRSTTRNIQMTSTVYFPTLKSYRDASEGTPAAIGQSIPGLGNNYGVIGNPSLQELQGQIAQLDGGKHCYLYPTGLAAIAAALDCFVDPGQQLLVPDAVYGPARAYCEYLREHKGVDVEYYESDDANDLRRRIKADTQVIYVESPASVTFELTDYEAVVALAKECNAVTIADNTWASFYLSQPLKFGFDVSITALTKYAAGYSDVFMGSVTLRDDSLVPLFHRHHRFTGAYASPFDATMISRGLETLEVRMRQHASNALRIIDLLNQLPHKIIYFNQPDSATFSKYFTGINGLLSIELDRIYSDGELARFFDSLDVFRLGESWGGTHSLVVPFDPDDFSARKQGPTNTLLRIHSGLEPIDDQLEDLRRAFSRLFG
jgi:cysteine-S-conjugate beta-lyase